MIRKNSVVKTTSKNLQPFLITLLVLASFGVLMIFNATSVHSNELYGDPYRLVVLQLMWLVIGSIGFIFFYKFDYQKLEPVIPIFFFLTLLILGLTSLAGILPCSVNIPFTPCINGANRWFYLNPPPFPQLPLFGVLGFQPSELAKLSLVLFLSYKLSKTLKNGLDPFKVLMLYAGSVALLVILQPNMSTAVLLFAIGIIIYFVSGASLKPLFYLFPITMLVGVIGMLSSSYRRDRLLTFLGMGKDSALNIDYHINQIQIALGSGGFLGLGLGQSRQKFSYLPETATDSIFAIVGEELGFVGAVFVLSLFAFLAYKGLHIALNAPTLFGRLLVSGIIGWIMLQVFVNIAAMTNLIPLTGVPIPLISYGGSSLVFTLMGLGVVANVARQSE